MASQWLSGRDRRGPKYWSAPWTAWKRRVFLALFSMMLSTQQPLTLMPTATINNTTWTETNGPLQNGSFTIRQCWLARPVTAFVPVELTLIAAALVETVWG